MFDHVLVATDLSDASDSALLAAAALARDLGARVTVLHVLPLDGAAPDPAERTTPRAVQARMRVAEIVAELRGRGLRAEGALRFGSPAEQIVEGALEGRAELIVTGPRRRGWLARTWYGDVAEQVARRSPVPVLALPAPARPTVVVARRPRRRQGPLRDNVILLRPRRAPGANGA